MMREPNIQVQNNAPSTLVNSEWVGWATHRIAGLEAAVGKLLPDLIALQRGHAESWEVTWDFEAVDALAALTKEEL